MPAGCLKKFWKIRIMRKTNAYKVSPGKREAEKAG
jgi:hypothetical protein